MKRRLSGLQAFLRFFYPARCSNILPETVKAKTKKPFLVKQHTRIGVPGRAELSNAVARLHIVEDPRLQHLNHGKHQLCGGNRKCRCDSCLAQPVYSSIALDCSRAVPLC